MPEFNFGQEMSCQGYALFPVARTGEEDEHFVVEIVCDLGCVAIDTKLPISRPSSLELEKQADHALPDNVLPRKCKLADLIRNKANGLKLSIACIHHGDKRVSKRSL